MLYLKRVYTGSANGILCSQCICYLALAGFRKVLVIFVFNKFFCFSGLPACDHSSIHCGAKADCFNINGTDTCVCEPGYSGNGSTCIGRCAPSAAGGKTFV